ncbi:PBECR2 nuclease fold domain-containing protein [Tahibacter soli]|uniref:Phage minor head protein n=1 Tax=Tahibacter soli TaxID=2983605 RepID=A0A9X4BHY2_9GAMM|nr:PBECR2 nuclease fold domain-containing protein [Tahibacter soli]MDC8012928.1 phage minor head protein [Tahibacter soli]
MPEAVRYFGEKANVPSATWRDLWQGQHARAFTVAGAMKADLLADLRQAVDGAIRDGESLGKFRQRFDDIVARHGWAHTGSRNWRTKVIYDTNVRTSFMAGKYAQLTDPDMLARHPYWEYRHFTRDNPRLEHKAWSGLILRHDDPWWQVHFPPNGWGCHCDVLPATARRLRELGKDGPDTAPAGVGDVRPEWQYNVGEAAWGRPIADTALRDLTDGGWSPPGTAPAGGNALPALPVDTAVASPLPATSDPTSIRNVWRDLYGEQSVLADANGGRVVLSDRVVEHWLDAPAERLGGRERFLPLLRELIEQPAEIWTNWIVNARGRYELRRRFVKAVTLDDNQPVELVAESTAGGVWLRLAFDADTVALARQGLLVWKRSE